MNNYKYTILCVDDEESILSALRRMLRNEDYRIITAVSGVDGLKLLEENEVHVVISDQRMPGMSGTEFLAIVMDRFPDIVRIILSGYTDVDTISESINKGHIYKFMLKPWNVESLKLEVKRALDYYELLHVNKLLHKKILKQNRELKNINDNLGNMVKKRTEELEIQNQALELSREILECLPIPIIGVSEEGFIVLINQRAETLSFSGRKITIGSELSDYFPLGPTELLHACLKNKVSQCVKDYFIGEDLYDLEFSPLNGKFSGRGVILSLKIKECLI